MGDTLTITDNRTGKQYELPITDGTIRAADLRQIKVNEDEFGMMSYDPAFLNTANCRSRITFIDGDQGILAAHGDQGGGYALYVEDGRLFHVHNGYGTMTEVDCGPMVDGTSDVVLAVKAIGDLIWDTTVLVDGAAAAQTPGLAVLMAMAPFEGIDVGIDRRSPVSWLVYNRHGPFPYTGILHSVTYAPGELAPDAGPLWVDVLREAATKYE